MNFEPIDMKPFPKVSIIIPVFNGANYLRDAIESALAQSYPNIEIIVVNDGSNDSGETEAIAKEFDGKIAYFFKPNGGVSTALNLGIEKMTGDYFSWLSHDDLYTVEKVQSQIDVLSTFDKPERIIVYSNYQTLFVDRQQLQEIQLQMTEPNCFRYQIATENKLHGCSLLIPRLAFSEFGSFDESLRATQDYDLWFKFAKKYSFIHLPKALVIGRVHDSQVGLRMKALVFKENVRYRKKCLDELTDQEVMSATNKTKSLSYVILVEKFIRKGLYPVALHSLMASLKSIPNDGIESIVRWPLFFLRSVSIGSIYFIYASVRKIRSR